MAEYPDDPLFFRVDDDGIADNREEEEEALSLSGLALELGQNDRPCHDGDVNPLEGSESGSESEFEFGLGSVEMRAADDLFFQGMILPMLRDGSGGPSSVNECLGESPVLSTVEPVSRSDSLESGSTGRVLSTSSRSSSKGSEHSSSGSTSSASTSFGSSRVMYHSSSTSYLLGSCQSPGPQTGFPGSCKTALLQGKNNVRSKSHRSSASSLSSSSSMMWEFFRPGLVRTPDIELHDLKTRTSNNSNGNNNNNCDDYDHEKQGKKNKKKKGMRGFGLLGGCKCTADSVATNLVLLRSDSSRIRSRRKSNVGSGEEEQLRRKLMELIETDDSRMKKAKAKKEATAASENNRRVPSSSSRRRRTFEWVKELPRTAAGGGYSVLHQYY